METKTYEFWSLGGRYMGTVSTNDPDQAASELSHFSGVDVDEIEWEVCETPQEDCHD